MKLICMLIIFLGKYSSFFTYIKSILNRQPQMKTSSHWLSLLYHKRAWAVPLFQKPAFWKVSLERYILLPELSLRQSMATYARTPWILDED